MLRTNAEYAFGLKFARFMAMNDDLTIPTVDRIIGGAGPFDFSGATAIAAVPMTVKIDNAAAVSFTVNLSAAVSAAAVTVDELVTALDTAFGTALLDLDASKDTTNEDRLKIANTNTAAVPDWIQIYGECAELCFIGQGKGLKFVKTDTLQSAGETPNLKDEETFTTTDADGIDTEILSDGYRKGFSETIVDTAEDWELRSLIEGGTYSSSAGTYEVPTSEDDKVYFFCEIYYAKYAQGTNKEADLIGYVKKLHRSCKGTIGDATNERAFMNGNYTITGTSYRDENDVLYGDTALESLTVSEYKALNLDTV